ncbi:hypothetical protein C9374_000860 [Naegleria lovaniensis]|uniref:Pentacotripeptide-repeat region of PRORP domain-containing protein n=1 Tax=Naegleria lovaniensis TaxID=51637 RepID=A0AA88GSD8_NAELO|nr:uncharacterized protein C9374_000860 [Naegleria lovaniensis]KAG2388010.1 hypothetical protein C9374_000860 [Naegleria lovaniensis]
MSSLFLLASSSTHKCASSSTRVLARAHKPHSYCVFREGLLLGSTRTFTHRSYSTLNVSIQQQQQQGSSLNHHSSSILGMMHTKTQQCSFSSHLSAPKDTKTIKTTKNKSKTKNTSHTSSINNNIHTLSHTSNNENIIAEESTKKIPPTYEEVVKRKNEIMDTLDFYTKMKKANTPVPLPSSSNKAQGPLFEVYREVKFFLNENERYHLGVVGTLLDKLVDTIREVGDVETARTLLNLLTSRIDNCKNMDLSPEVVVKKLKLKPKITKLLQIIITQGNDVAGAIAFLRNSKNEHGQTAPYIGTSAFTVVLNGLVNEIKVFKPTCEHNSVVMKRAMELFNWMDESDEVLVPPDEFTFTALIRGYALICDMGMAMELYNQMSTEYGMKPPIVTKEIIIEGYIKEGNVDKAYEFFKENCTEEYDAYYNSLIAGFTQDGKLDKAYELVDEMISKNVTVSTSTYNSFLSGLVRSKNYTQQDIDAILKSMETRKLKPNSKTFSLIIKCLIQQGRLNEAIEYYGQHPEAIAGAKVIAASLLKTGRLEEAENLMEQMITEYKKHSMVDPHTMSRTIQYLIKIMLSVGSVKRAAFWRKQLPRITS